MAMNQTKLIAVLYAISDRIIAEKEYLTELDRPIGDNDHGINMCKGFEAVKTKLETMGEQDIGTILKTTGMTLVSAVGGSSGPLYGTLFMKMGMKLAGKHEITFDEFLDAFQTGIQGVGERGRSTTEEKTMLDALVPAMDAMKTTWEAEHDEKAAFQAGAQAAETGAEHTKELIATKGRASYVGERGIGHQDPGATSAMFMIRTVAEQI